MNLKCETKFLLPFLASHLWKWESLRVWESEWCEWAIIFENELKQKNRSFSFIRIGRYPKTANLWRSVAIIRDVCTSPAHSRHEIYFYIILERKRKKNRNIIRRNWELKNIVFVRILNGLAHIFFSISSSLSRSDYCCATGHPHTTTSSLAIATSVIIRWHLVILFSSSPIWNAIVCSLLVRHEDSYLLRERYRYTSTVTYSDAMYIIQPCAMHRLTEAIVSMSVVAFYIGLHLAFECVAYVYNLNTRFERIGTSTDDQIFHV